MLMQHLIKKDPVRDPLDALGSDSGGGSGGGSGARGCAARDALVKTLDDSEKVVATVRTLAAMSLGIPQEKVDQYLMRTFVERKFLLGDAKLLTYVSLLLAEMWTVCEETKSTKVQGLVARGLIMTEQVALDQGRTQLGWMMTGLPEPPFNQVQKNTRRPGIRPFAQLADPRWVAANIAYLRDMEFFETKLGGKGAPNQPREETDGVQPRAKYRPKNGKKGKPDAEE